jgi:hypothetical protein
LFDLKENIPQKKPGFAGLFLWETSWAIMPFDVKRKNGYFVC